MCKVNWGIMHISQAYSSCFKDKNEPTFGFILGLFSFYDSHPTFNTMFCHKKNCHFRLVKRLLMWKQRQLPTQWSQNVLYTLQHTQSYFPCWFKHTGSEVTPWKIKIFSWVTVCSSTRQKKTAVTSKYNCYSNYNLYNL